MNAKLMLAKILNRLQILHYFYLNISKTWGGGNFIIPVIGKTGFSHLYLTEDYDYAVYEFFRETIRKGIFLDVGANTGQTLLRVKLLNREARIVCVEPNPGCIWYIKKLVDANHLNDVTLVPCALFDTVGLKKLFVHQHEDSNASLMPGEEKGLDDARKPMVVNAITESELSTVVQDAVSFIKIDVEGAELHVVRSLEQMIRRFRPVIFCEVLDAHNEEARSSNNMQKEEIYKFIKGLSYEIYYFDRDNKQLRLLSSFPERIFKAENLDKCNYVFRPVNA